MSEGLRSIPPSLRGRLLPYTSPHNLNAARMGVTLRGKLRTTGNLRMARRSVIVGGFLGAFLFMTPVVLVLTI
jgi:hypothetical protein